MGKFKLKGERIVKEKQRYIMANLVYGPLYTDLWLRNQLKSLTDPTNLPALRDKYELEYAIFTDEETMRNITINPNYVQFAQHCSIHMIKLNWPADSDRVASRYNLLAQMIQQMVPVALERGAWLSCWVADLVFAKHALPRILKHLEKGHDAVFNVPLRSAADSLVPWLAKLPYAPTDLELFDHAYSHLHHLWVASLWNAPLFSRMPYSMLWKSEGAGLVAHNFAVTPIAFKPTIDMLNVVGGIDSDLPQHFTNPYWATDWTDAPVAGVEPLSNWHYPPFHMHGSSVEHVVDWAVRGNEGKPSVHPTQPDHLDKPLFYPSREYFGDEATAAEALRIAIEIQSQVRSQYGSTRI